ncbi:hypothetical protein AAFN86_28175 [Roseomonas sp. CAU 1739]|uniref:SDH family Clp fold serine proteinase n=1 Tax=Roseomonas sp. CAU 1739 TaxID=3140364 RepID=UPI00325BF747
MSGKRAPDGPPKSDGVAKASGKKGSGSAADKFAAGYDFLLINSPVDSNLYARVMQEVTKSRTAGGPQKAVVAIVTNGGLADYAYRTGRYLQSIYDDVVAFIPSGCKSAGTLMAVAANELIISPFGDLGPLDVQLLPKDDIIGRRSGLVTRSAISDLKTHTFELFEHFMMQIISSSGGSVSFKAAADVAARTTAKVMGRIYEQVNPDMLGQDFRDLNVAMKYGERLNRRYKNLKPNGLRRLVHDYPAHDFVIDHEEAKEIFERVSLPTSSIWRFLEARMADMMMVKPAQSAIVEICEIPPAREVTDVKGHSDKESDDKDAPRTKPNGDGQRASGAS